MKLLKNYQPSYSDSTLANMTKEELIEQIRVLEHNIDTQVRRVEEQKRTIKRLITMVLVAIIRSVSFLG